MCAYPLIVDLRLLEKDLTRIQRLIEDIVELEIYLGKHLRAPWQEIMDVILEIPLPQNYYLVLIDN